MYELEKLRREKEEVPQKESCRKRARKEDKPECKPAIDPDTPESQMKIAVQYYYDDHSRTHLDFFHATATKIGFINMSSTEISQFHAHFDLIEKVGLQFEKIFNSLGTAVTAMMRGEIQQLDFTSNCLSGPTTLCEKPSTDQESSCLICEPYHLLISCCHALLHTQTFEFPELMYLAHKITDSLERLTIHLGKFPGHCKKLKNHKTLGPHVVAKLYKHLYHIVMFGDEDLEQMSRYIVMFHSMLDRAIKYFPRNNYTERCIQNYTYVSMAPTFLTQDTRTRELAIYFSSCDSLHYSDDFQKVSTPEFSVVTHMRRSTSCLMSIAESLMEVHCSKPNKILCLPCPYTLLKPSFKPVYYT